VRRERCHFSHVFGTLVPRFRWWAPGAQRRRLGAQFGYFSDVFGTLVPRFRLWAPGAQRRRLGAHFSYFSNVFGTLVPRFRWWAPGAQRRRLGAHFGLHLGLCGRSCLNFDGGPGKWAPQLRGCVLAVTFFV